MGSDATVPWLRSKIMVVGKGAAGKTNTVRSLIGMQLHPEWDSTVGVNLTEVSTLGPYWKKTKKSDFAINFLHRLAVEHVEEPHKLRGQLSATKLDVSQRQVVKETQESSESTNELIQSTNEGTQAVASNQKSQDQTFQYKEELYVAQEDAQDSIRISIWDYGGQKVFYTLHHLFLTRYGVYLIVFDMSKFLETTNEASEHLLFWLNSIKLHAPNAPVLLVGTFLDVLKSNFYFLQSMRVQAVLQEIDSIVQPICSGFSNVCAFGDLVYCPTSNKDKQGVQILREAVERETRNADFVRTPVSLKWMRALDILGNYSNTAWMSLTDLKRELKKIGLQGEVEIEKMLGLFHELGVVLYFSSSVRLREIVIWKPEWLLQKFSLVIRDKQVHKYNMREVEEAQLTEDLDQFLQEAIASRDLLELLWEKSHVDYLLELMRHLMLLSDWTFSEEQRYLIPSMLSTSKDPPNIEGSQFNLEFNFLPQGVFERMCCLCIGYSSSLTQVDPPRLSKTSFIVDLGTKGILQVHVKGSNTISVTQASAMEARATLDFFLSMLLKIQNDFMHGGLKWQVMVKDKERFVKHEDAKAQGLQPWSEKNKTTHSPAIEKFLDL